VILLIFTILIVNVFFLRAWFQYYDSPTPNNILSLKIKNKHKIVLDARLFSIAFKIV
jgi:hypothetical protein